MVRWHSPGSGTGVSAASNEANSQRSQSSYNKSLSNVSIETRPNAHTERNTTLLLMGDLDVGLFRIVIIRKNTDH